MVQEVGGCVVAGYVHPPPSIHDRPDSITDLELPLSTSKERPDAVTTIAITKEEVLSDGRIIAPISTFAAQDSLTIPALYDYMAAAGGDRQEQTDRRRVMIQSDREVEFNIVKRVMYTCSRAGYTDFTILVIEEG